MVNNIELEMAIKNLQLQARFVGEVSDDEIRIEELIRQKYSLSQEMMLHRRKAMGTLEEDEWNEYTAYVEECIVKAREDHPDGTN